MSQSTKTPRAHKWFVHPKFRPLVTCKWCGAVKRHDGKNGSCAGKVRVELRDNRIGASPSGVAT